MRNRISALSLVVLSLAGCGGAADDGTAWPRLEFYARRVGGTGNCARELAGVIVRSDDQATVTLEAYQPFRSDCLAGPYRDGTGLQVDCAATATQPAFTLSLRTGNEPALLVGSADLGEVAGQSSRCSYRAAAVRGE